MTELERFLEARDFLLDARGDYHRAVSEFRWPALESFNWASDFFDVIAAANDAPALVIVEPSGTVTRRTYAELSSRSSQVANLLSALGITRGDRVLVMLGNELALWEVVLAVIKLGAVMIPTTPLLAGADLADRLTRSSARILVANDTGAAVLNALPDASREGLTLIGVGSPGKGWIAFDDADLEEAFFSARAPTASSDPLIEYFTSGTTTRPKLVRHTHASYPVGHLSTMFWLGLRPADIHWTISSPGWAKHAWGCFFAPFNAQACVFVYNYERFDGRAVLETLVEHEVTTLCTPPTVWRFLIQEDIAAHAVHLRELISAGEPLNPEVIEHVRDAWGIGIRDGYGQTETTAQIGNPPGIELRPGSMGLPLPGYEITLLGADGTPADEGEISIALDRRPLALMDGYADDQQATDEAMAGGFYRTGDIGRRDADGYITYVGRADDVFKASGYRISPFEIESALIEHAAVAEAAVVPSPDPMRGFVPKAYVILAPDHDASAATARSVSAHTRARVSGYKRVRRLEFSDLPKTISGKIRRVELRAQEEDRPDSGTRNEREFLEEELRD